jgi:3-oxoacyl-[acyl-carrier protein] reductase
MDPGHDPRHSAGPDGRAGEIAAAAVFLASDEAGFITGQNLAVNGGMSFL